MLLDDQVLLELFELVDMEEPVEEQQLEDPEDGERRHVGRQDDHRLLEVREVVLDADVASDRHEALAGTAPERYAALKARVEKGLDRP